MNSRLREVIRLGVAPEHAHWASCLNGGKGGSAPPPPDYRGAALEQAAASKEIATQQTWANRPEQYTPWGSTNWNAYAGTDPATGQAITRWVQQEQLTPQLQEALNRQIGVQNYRSGLGQQFAGRVEQDMAQPYNWANLPSMAMGPGVQDYGAQRQRIEESLYNRMAPVHQAQEDQLRTRLANQGLTQGSQAFEGELQRLRESQAAERFNAMQTAGTEQQRLFGMDEAAGNFANRVRQQAIAEQSQQRNMSLNELNALLTGQQVQQPQMPAFQQASAGQAPNLLGAAQALGNYNVSMAQAEGQDNSSLWGGLGQLAGTAAKMYMMSDVRLKTDIKRIGTHPLGVAIYSYKILGIPSTGVMAHELVRVRPDLVAVHPSGYLMVDYGGL